MPKAVRITVDIQTGVCNHGLPCCPHFWTGFYLSGSPTTDDCKQKLVRLSDQGFNSCPHCHWHMSIMGSPIAFDNKLPISRVGDVCISGAGQGLNITGSPITTVE